MKDYTSRFLKFVAWVYLGFPVAYLVAAAILFDVPVAGMEGILTSPVFYLAVVTAVLTGYGLREMRRWAWYLMMVSTALVALENAIIIRSYAETHHKILSYAVSLVLLAALTRRISGEIRVPYFFPKIRWWESNPRYRLSVPVRCQQAGSEARDAGFVGEILDLSMGGCFVKLRADIAQDEAVALSFRVFGLPVECRGVVVWRTQSTVTHPRGIGVKFAHTTRAQRRVLKQVTHRLRKIASLYRRSRYLLSQDEFLKRLDELESTEIAS